MSIQSVDRALQILALFSHRCPTLGVTEISQAVGLSKGTVHGLIRTLLRQGFLQQDLPSRKYRLGMKIYELGIILAGTLEINQKAAGPVTQLAKTAQMVGRVAIWDGDSVIITFDVHPRIRAVLPYRFGPRVHFVDARPEASVVPCSGSTAPAATEKRTVALGTGLP